MHTAEIVFRIDEIVLVSPNIDIKSKLNDVSPKLTALLLKRGSSTPNSVHCFHIIVHYAVLSKLTALFLNYVHCRLN